MNKDWKYILYLCGAVGLFLILKLMTPKEHNWTITYAPKDKNPYGGYAFGKLLPSVFPGATIHHGNKTIYELKDSLATNDNLMIVATQFSSDKEDVKVMLNHVNNGGNVFISSHYFYGIFSDTLGIATYDYFFNGADLLEDHDTTSLQFAALSMDTTQQYFYRQGNAHNYFSDFDTTRTTVIARNENRLPVTIRVAWGKGSFILNTTPMAFTNIYLLNRQNHAFIANTLSFLPTNPVHWTEYYQTGRMEISTPLRFVLTTEPLKWAYYIVVGALVLFMLFEMKRKQRIIPIIKPLANTTLEFVNTIGNLYYQRAEHKNIAEKRIHYFMDHLRTRYWLSAITLNDAFVQTLTQKSGKPEADVRALVYSIMHIQSRDKITADELMDFNQKIEKFNG